MLVKSSSLFQTVKNIFTHHKVSKFTLRNSSFWRPKYLTGFPLPIELIQEYDEPNFHRIIRMIEIEDMDGIIIWFKYYQFDVMYVEFEKKEILINIRFKT